MRVIGLQICGAITALVLLAMLTAVARHRAQRRPEAAYHTTAIEEYVWAAIPWLMVAVAVLPAVRQIMAAPVEVHASPEGRP
jgi:heme/copper-type cytochrome/quinol oxidase subunit 2